MDENIGAKGTRESLTSFGKTVGLGFLFFGLLLLGIWYWSGGDTGSFRYYLGIAFLGVSAFLIVMAYLAPMLLSPFETVWWAFARVMNAIMTRVILGVFYYMILTPVGLVMRLFGRDPMDRKIDRQRDSYWTPRKPPDDINKHCERQF